MTMSVYGKVHGLVCEFHGAPNKNSGALPRQLGLCQSDFAASSSLQPAVVPLRAVRRNEVIASS